MNVEDLGENIDSLLHIRGVYREQTNFKHDVYPVLN